MITIITDITDSDILKTYWCPLICKYREMQFIFGRTKDVIRPKMKDWSNVRFAAKNNAKGLVSFANTKFVYMTVQNEIPTYELMVRLREPQEGLVPKIHGSNKDSSSYVISKENYINKIKFNKTINDVTTYVI